MSFSSINPEDIQISSDSIVSTLWSNNQTTLNNIYKKSSNTTPYIPIYESDPSLEPTAETQFSLSYGHIYGSGSSPINPLVEGITPTRISYGQIRTLINGDENTPINFGVGNNESKDVIIINLERARYKEKLFLNTFNLHLSGSSGSIQLTNNSKDSNNVNYCDAGRVFDIVSGSNGNSIINGGLTVSGSYGKFLPDVGLILLNPSSLTLPFVSGGVDLTIDYNNNTNALENNNNSIYNLINNGGYFSLNSEETITSDYVFIRVKNSEFNYTTNPSIINSNGEFYHTSLVNNPQTFITTVGLYNDKNELLAVAKLSKPLKKDFTKEALLRIKLDF
jgi:hypothetical protein